MNPKEWKRNFAIDIAFPNEKIGILGAIIGNIISNVISCLISGTFLTMQLRKQTQQQL